MTQRNLSKPVRQGPFDRYMMHFRREMGESSALMLAEYEREFIVPIREWANQPWWKRIFSSPKDFEIKVPMTPESDPIQADNLSEPEPEPEPLDPQLVDAQGGMLEQTT